MHAGIVSATFNTKQNEQVQITDGWTDDPFAPLALSGFFKDLPTQVYGKQMFWVVGISLER